MWTHRIILEGLEHSNNTFVTLTYDDEHLPADGNLQPDHMTAFIKSLRAKLNPDKIKPTPEHAKIRYYLVGEYGDDSERPHYHLALFNYPNCVRGQSLYSRYNLSCCTSCDVIRDVWGRGNVLLGELTPHSAQYTAGYIIKKLQTELVDTHRTPEFQRMSNRPGLGSDAMHRVAAQLKKYGLDKTIEDVPTTLRHGKKQYPLGSYLRGNLRELIGRDKKAPQAVHDKLAQEMLPVQLASKNSKKGESTAKINNEINSGKHARLEGRDKLYNSRNKL